MAKVTTIELSHAALRAVGEILKKAGFKLGTVGGGYGEMEREGEISTEEVTSLRLRMAEVLFTFDTYESGDYLEEDEGPQEDEDDYIDSGDFDVDEDLSLSELDEDSDDEV